jgi:hypothetical protein
MTCFTFLQFLLLTSFLVQGAAALANREAPSAFSSASEQALLGGYAHGESYLFGGPKTFGPNQEVWAGRKAQATSKNEEERKEVSAFVPNKKRDSSFTP